MVSIVAKEEILITAAVPCVFQIEGNMRDLRVCQGRMIAYGSPTIIHSDRGCILGS